MAPRPSAAGLYSERTILQARRAAKNQLNQGKADVGGVGFG
jgi:hypothetical protein